MSNSIESNIEDFKLLGQDGFKRHGIAVVFSIHESTGSLGARATFNFQYFHCNVMPSVSAEILEAEGSGGVELCTACISNIDSNGCNISLYDRVDNKWVSGKARMRIWVPTDVQLAS